MRNVKASRKNVFKEEGEGQAEGLFAKRITNEKGSGNKSQSRSKKGKCHYCHKS